MEDNKFWYSIWKLVAIVLCVLIVSASGCEMRRNKLLAESERPQELSCAFGVGENEASICTLLHANQPQQPEQR